MFKKHKISFLNFLNRLAVFIQKNNNKFSQLSIKHFYFIKKNNLLLIDHIYEANVNVSTQINNYWQEDLASQKILLICR